MHKVEAWYVCMFADWHLYEGIVQIQDGRQWLQMWANVISRQVAIADGDVDGRMRGWGKMDFINAYPDVFPSFVECRVSNVVSAPPPPLA